jgi:hypothetical protein
MHSGQCGKTSLQRVFQVHQTELVADSLYNTSLVSTEKAMNIVTNLQTLQSQLSLLGQFTQTGSSQQVTQLGTLLDSFSARLGDALTSLQQTNQTNTPVVTTSTTPSSTSSLLGTTETTAAQAASSTNSAQSATIKSYISAGGATGTRTTLGNLVYDLSDTSQTKVPVRIFAQSTNSEMISIDLSDPYSLVRAVEVHGVDRTQLKESLDALLAQQYSTNDRQNYLTRTAQVDPWLRGASFNNMDIWGYLDGSVALTTEQQAIISADYAADQRRLQRDALAA